MDRMRSLAIPAVMPVDFPEEVRRKRKRPHLQFPRIPLIRPVGHLLPESGEKDPIQAGMRNPSRPRDGSHSTRRTRP